MKPFIIIIALLILSGCKGKSMTCDEAEEVRNSIISDIAFSGRVLSEDDYIGYLRQTEKLLSNDACNDKYDIDHMLTVCLLECLGRYDDALDMYKRWSSTKAAGHPLSCMYDGYAGLVRNDSVMARVSFLNAVSVCDSLLDHSITPDIIMIKAEALGFLKENDRCRQCFETGAASFPDNQYMRTFCEIPDDYILMNNTWIEIYKNHIPVDSARKKYRFSPEGHLLLYLSSTGQFEEDMARVRKRTERADDNDNNAVKPSDIWNEMMEMETPRAKEYLEPLLDKCDVIIRRDSGDITPYALKSWILKELHRYESALDVMSEFYNRLPADNPDRLFHEGTVLDIKGDTVAAYRHYREASQRWEKILKETPSDTLYQKIASARMLLGETLSAYEFLKTGHERYPLNPELAAFCENPYLFYLTCHNSNDDYKKALQGDSYIPPRPFTDPRRLRRDDNTIQIR